MLAALLARDDEIDHAIDERVEREVIALRERTLHVLDGEHEVRLAGDRDAIRQPAGLAAHGLDDEVARRRDRVGAEVHDLFGHDVDRGEEAEREVDAAVVVVDRLREVHDLHAARLGREALLILVEKVRGLQRVVAADRDQRVDVEIDERVVDVAQVDGLLQIVEVVGLFDPLAGVRARGADDDAARVAQAGEVLELEDAVVLVGQEPVRDRVVVLEVRVAVEEPDHVAAVFEERDRSRRDHRVGGRRGATGEHEADALDVVAFTTCGHGRAD